MKHLLIFSIFIAVGTSAQAQMPVDSAALKPVEANAKDQRIEYIKNYRSIAIREMESGGVPASIKLAQAILESNAGQSTLAREANNHFGIKCHKDWKGKGYYLKDDDKGADGNLIESCFRIYKHPEEGFADHTAFLRDPKKYYRYGFLFDMDRRDYRSWAYGLQSAGYATSQTYAESLIRIIEEYKLSEFDSPGASDSDIAGGPVFDDTKNSRFPTRRRNSGSTSPAAGRSATGRVNDVKAIRAMSGMTLQAIGRRYGVNPQKLACYNDCQIGITQTLNENEVVYLANKRKKYRGRQREHFVQKDETMFSIAQKYGVKLMSLYTLNNMQGGTEPEAGEKIKLKGKKRSDSVRTRAGVASKPGQPGTRPDPSPYKPGDELFDIGGDAKPAPPTPAPTPPPTTPGNRPQTTGQDARPDSPVVPTPTPPTGTTTKPANPSGGSVGSAPTPPPTSTPAAPAPAGYHTVIKGDTLYNISKRYGLSVDQLRTLNNMATNDIKIGQLLKVK